MPTIAELTQEQYEALPFREQAAVAALIRDQDEGRISPMSSDNDLTPRELADERDARRREEHNDGIRRIRREALDAERAVRVGVGRGKAVHGSTSVVNGHGGYIHPRALCMPSSTQEYAHVSGTQDKPVTCKRCLASMAAKGLS